MTWIRGLFNICSKQNFYRCHISNEIFLNQWVVLRDNNTGMRVDLPVEKLAECVVAPQNK